MRKQLSVVEVEVPIFPDKSMTFVALKWRKQIHFAVPQYEAAVLGFDKLKKKNPSLEKDELDLELRNHLFDHVLSPTVGHWLCSWPLEDNFTNQAVRMIHEAIQNGKIKIPKFPKLGSHCFRILCYQVEVIVTEDEVITRGDQLLTRYFPGY